MPDPASDYTTAWARFQAAQSVMLREDTLEGEWKRGRKYFVAFLIIVRDDSARADIVSKVAEIGAIPGIDPYPHGYWHITVKGVGFLSDAPSRPDELSPEDARRLAEDARETIEALPAFPVTIGVPNAFPEVVFLEVDDGGVVRALNERLLENLPALTRSPIDGAMFLPHISIARYSSNEGLSALKQALGQMRTAVTGPTFTAREVVLIQARLSEDAPTFELLSQYSLRG